MEDITFNYAMSEVVAMLERIALALESIERRT